MGKNSPLNAKVTDKDTQEDFLVGSSEYASVLSPLLEAKVPVLRQ